MSARGVRAKWRLVVNKSGANNVLDRGDELTGTLIPNLKAGRWGLRRIKPRDNSYRREKKHEHYNYLTSLENLTVCWLQGYAQFKYSTGRDELTGGETENAEQNESLTGPFLRCLFLQVLSMALRLSDQKLKNLFVRGYNSGYNKVVLLNMRLNPVLSGSPRTSGFSRLYDKKLDKDYRNDESFFVLRGLQELIAPGGIPSRKQMIAVKKWFCTKASGQDRIALMRLVPSFAVSTRDFQRYSRQSQVSSASVLVSNGLGREQVRNQQVAMSHAQG